jgi:hypothetical protein
MDTPSAHEFAWTVKQAMEALLAANDRDPWGFHYTIFDANGRPVGKIEVEPKPE